MSQMKRDQSPFSVIISSARANLKQFNVRMRTDLADAVDTAEKSLRLSFKVYNSWCHSSWPLILNTRTSGYPS